MNQRLRAWGVGALALLVLGAVAACSNADPDREAVETNHTEAPATTGSAPPGGYPAVDQPGVTDTEIKVAGVASVNNAVGGNFGSAFDGTKAYFDMINAQGGVYGRELMLSEEIDDGGIKNKDAVQPLLTADIFAVVPVATILFNGADDLVAAGIPTYGWTINPEWAGTEAEPRANLFGHEGSYIGITDPQPMVPFLAQEAGATKVGIIAYGVPQSSACADAYKRGVETWGGDVEVVYVDATLRYGEPNMSVQVGEMKDEGVDFIATCIDTNGVVTLATEMDKQGLEATQYLANGYDHAFAAEFGDLFEGAFVRTTFATWEIPEEGRPEGLEDFLTWMESSGAEPTENAAVGWVNANLFVDGLLAAGPDFTRESVIAATNAMTDWNAKGMTMPIDWTRRHTELEDPDIFCMSISKIEDGEFTAPYAEPGKPYLCVDGSDRSELVGTSEP